MTKSDGVTQVLAGGTLVYTIQYGNSGTVPATNVIIVDTLPGNVTYQSYSSSPSITCALDGPPVTKVTCNAGTVVAGSGSVQITVTVRSDQPTGAVVLNRVSIESDRGRIDKNPADDTISDSDAVSRRMW